MTLRKTSQGSQSSRLAAWNAKGSREGQHGFYEELTGLEAMAQLDRRILMTWIFPPHYFSVQLEVNGCGAGSRQL